MPTCNGCSVTMKPNDLWPNATTAPPRYFFSVLAVFRDGASTALSLHEWLQYYLEEGTEHFFLLDCSRAHTMTESHGIAPYRVSRLLMPAGASTCGEEFHTSLLPMLSRATIWLAIVEPDEYLISRSFPQATLRGMLVGANQRCEVLGVPRLAFWDASRGDSGGRQKWPSSGGGSSGGSSSSSRGARWVRQRIGAESGVDHALVVRPSRTGHLWADMALGTSWRGGSIFHCSGIRVYWLRPGQGSSSLVSGGGATDGVPLNASMRQRITASSPGWMRRSYIPAEHKLGNLPIASHRYHNDAAPPPSKAGWSVAAAQARADAPLSFYSGRWDGAAVNDGSMAARAYSRRDALQTRAAAREAAPGESAARRAPHAET
eukprot:2186674-Prymnesium_polylepis.2